MGAIKLKSNESSIDTSTFAGKVFRDSFVSYGDFTTKEMESMVETWVDVEDFREILHVILDDELQEIDKSDLAEEPVYMDDNE